MRNLSFEEMENVQGSGPFWGSSCEQYDIIDCWRYGTNCRNYYFWIPIGETFESQPEWAC